MQSKLVIRSKSSTIIKVSLTIIIISNILFYILYFGYYQRNPWVSGPYNADDMNKVIKQLKPIINEFSIGDDIVAYGYSATIVYDILGFLKTGNIAHTPNTVKYPELSFDVLECIPQFVIVSSNYGSFYVFDKLEKENIINLIHIITINENDKVYIYKLRERTTSQLYIYAPIPSPILAPEYFMEILILQHKFIDKKFCFDNDEHLVTRPYFSVEYIDKLVLNTTKIDLTNISNYNYIIGEHQAGTPLYLEFKENNSTKRLGYMPYPSLRNSTHTIAIDIQKLAVNKLEFINLHNITLTKDLYINNHYYSIEP